MNWLKRKPKSLSPPKLPRNYVLQPHDEIFYPGELVMLGKEFDEHKCSGRSSDTPVYRIIRKRRDDTNLCFHYQLESLQTEEGLKHPNAKNALRVFPGQEIEELEERGEKGQSVEKDWDTKTLVGGDDGVAFRDGETLRGDDDERDAVWGG